MAQAEYIDKRELQHVLAALTPENRLACEVQLATGLRISDILELKTKKLDRRMTITERKTGKRRRIYLNDGLLMRLRAIAGPVWVFEGRCDGRKHRTREAVYKDLRRAAALFRVKPHISTHTGRKVWAVGQYRKDYDLARLQSLMNHSRDAYTILYAIADELTERKRTGRASKK